VAKFKCGDFSTCDAPRPGRPKTVTTPEIFLLESSRYVFTKYSKSWFSQNTTNFIVNHKCGDMFRLIVPYSGQRVLFLHENALGHRTLVTQKKLAYLGFQCLDHSSYSSDLAPSDYHLFPGLKKQLKGRHLSSDAEVIAAAETWLDGQSS